MVSQGSFCDSDCVPGFMQEDDADSTDVGRTEEGFSTPDFSARKNPILASGEVFKQLMSGKTSSLVNLNNVDYDTAGENVVPSSSGGINIVAMEEVLVEDASSEEEAPISREEEGWMENATLNPAVKLAFALNRNEREELISTKRQLNELSRFLKTKGFSFEDVLLEARSNNGDHTNYPRRDEFGLPVLQEVRSHSSGVGVGPSDLKSILKKRQIPEKLSRVSNGETIVENCSKQPEGTNGILLQTVAENQPIPPAAKSWSKVVQSNEEQVHFEYIPMPEGSKVLSPPDEVLRQGNEKFKLCIVGTFSKGTHPYSVVKRFAQRFWEGIGLCDVFQKAEKVFLFKFKDEDSMNKVLSKGTWYVDQRPMLVKAWCEREKPVTSMPLWIKLTNIPDCYWTQKGLSSLASVVGVPISADSLTSKLNILPFARFCVEYKLGTPLPSTIPVLVLDPMSEEKSQAEVHVHYAVKPLTCVACNSLGHTTASCPLAKRIWVQKMKKGDKDSSVTEFPPDIEGNNSAILAEDSQQQSPKSPIQEPTLDGELKDKGKEKLVEEEPWTEVKSHSRHSTTRKGSVSPLDSPTPPNIFKKLVNVDEVDARKRQNVAPLFSDSHKRRLRKKGGGNSPNKSH
ncbi:hypothetical protein POM88_013517 [Heracleum sosnowskyi]|uniref:DUF4283 domain-containing protein n=1 Tax=Heracleum sosnowskyi TaxID=360622 RepID=A0AAD8IZ93_9APIA|nr:hypothetical protein POM88_013516 [Heracleum sosnowskyi]KAK1394461.1 hypothetical protein POM88_013517 [Heracleum sosnowskyi]